MSKDHFNYSLLWDKLLEYAKHVGRASTRPILLMYYVLKSPDTPKSEKIIVYSALAYVILPIDLISAKRFPIIGWMDEVVSLTVVYQKICKYITPEMEVIADAILDKWFPDDTSCEVVE